MSEESAHPPGSSCGDAPLYALGLLQPHELASFLEHAQTCVVCRDEIASLEPAVDALGESVPQLRAPSTLRRSVLDAVRAEESVSASISRGAETPRRRRLRLRRVQPAVALAGACATFALGAVLGIFAFGSSAPETVSKPAEVSFPNASASLHRSGSHVWLTVAHMPSPGKGRVYEVWLERGKSAPSPTSALFAPTASGAGEVAITGDLAGVSEILVTSEPEGGSLTPTRSPVIVGRLSSS